MIQWAHSTKFSCHLGKNRTCPLIQHFFWWPSLARDVQEFVSACPNCAQKKVSNSPPAGLLRPLHVPWKPWSHIALDLITGLPPSSGNSVILTTVDCFSNAAHCLGECEAVDQPRVPPTWHPKDIVCDRGPQFSLRVWKEFCSVLGAQVFPPDFTLIQTDRLKGPIRSWRRCSVCCPQISPSGALNWRGWSTHTTR